MITGKHGKAQPELAHLAHATYPLGFGFGAGQRRQQHRRQNGDNGDYHQQFDQGETRSRRHWLGTPFTVGLG